MTTLRLMADDLTGALDTAAELVAWAGPVAVRCAPLSASDQGQFSRLAIDIGTREAERSAAIATAAGLAPMLAGADISFVKVDSLLRGHGMAELAACWRLGAWDHCIVAPAFPYQGRITRAGVQYRRSDRNDWIEVADLNVLATDAGLISADANRATHGDVRILDVETDADLDRIVGTGRSLPGRVLWCGSAGLARALAGIAGKTPAPKLERPMLGIFGSDQPTTARQLELCGAVWMRLGADIRETDARRVTDNLARRGAAFVSFAVPDGQSRDRAAAMIAGAIGGLLPRLPRPGTLIVAGGETLRAVCLVLGASGFVATGRIEPGLPLSTLSGGRWDGLQVVSKSGAFGRDGVWRELLAVHGLIERVEE